MVNSKNKPKSKYKNDIRKLKVNISVNERVFRILASIFFFTLALTKNEWWLVAAVILLVTGIVGWCPLYQMFNINRNNKVNKR